RTGLVLLCCGALLLLGEERGGAVGTALDAVFGRLLGGTGMFILGLFLCWGGALLLTGASLGAILRHSARVARDTAVAARRTVRYLAPEDVSRGQTPGHGENGHVQQAPPVDGEQAYPDVVGDGPGSHPVLVDQLADFGGPGDAAGRTEPEPTAEPPTLFDPPTSEHAGYRLPDAGVLRRSRPHDGQPGKAAERTAEALLQALANFGIDATLVGQVVGPRVTRYELQLAPGTKVGKVAALKDDLAYALATTEIRILAPIPGKQAVGVEVPNLSPNIVTLGDIFDELPASASPLTAWLGKDISGASVHADLARMPHILIAGTTGSGKSGCINTMLCSILLRATPDDVRMILVDPKRVELGLYESIPHLLTPVVSSPKTASAVLTNVLTEMERRYERMSLARARNLSELNRALRKRGDQTLPYLLVVIDELADLMMVSPQEVEDAVIRLAQKSRAVGIHLVLATQRPSVDVITGMIKANVPSRIAFAVSSQTDSRVILDTSGAESLLGQGDMLFKP
ncbi:MAG: DNA translocase FtsK, partial [Gaiellaceae bacterium]